MTGWLGENQGEENRPAADSNKLASFGLYGRAGRISAERLEMVIPSEWVLVDDRSDDTAAGDLTTTGGVQTHNMVISILV